jgi:tetratricopeptide (TPR) repeat protein
MPLVQAKCTTCGAALEVDSSNEAAICPFCKSAYIVEKAINEYHVTADTVNISGGYQAETLVTRAKMLCDEKRWDEAKELIDEALKLNPQLGSAHVTMVLIDAKCDIEHLSEACMPLQRSGSYTHALAYSDETTKKLLQEANDTFFTSHEKELEAIRAEVKNTQEIVDSLQSEVDSGKATSTVLGFSMFFIIFVGGIIMFGLSSVSRSGTSPALCLFATIVIGALVICSCIFISKANKTDAIKNEIAIHLEKLAVAKSRKQYLEDVLG